MMKFNRLASGVALAAMLSAAGTAVCAQETTSAIHGAVTSNGMPVAGASVQLVHVPSGTKSTFSTEAGGSFDARGLRVGGPYTVTVTGAGLPSKTLNDVFLQVGHTTDVDVDLTAKDTGNEVEAVIVTAAGVKNADQGPKTVLGRKAIQEVVSITRDPRDLARRDMLVAADLNSGARIGVNGGGVSIAGSNPRYNRIAVDGVSAQDNFGLNQGGLTTARGPVNLDAIEQFAVAAVPTDVENGDFVGGALNLVLRSGGNQFHGAFFDNYLNDGMVGREIEGNKIKSNVHQTNYGAFLSGPVWKDHIFFAVSYETYTSAESTQFGVQGSGAPNAFLNNGTQATLDKVVSDYNTLYKSKFDPGGIVATTPVLDKKYSAKLDWNLMEGQRFSFTYRYAESSNVLHPNLGNATMQLSSQDYTKFDSDEAFTGELHSTWTDRLSTTLKITKRQFMDSQLPPSGQNYADVRVCTAPTANASSTVCESPFNQLNFGPDQFRHANALSEKEFRVQFTGEYSMAPNLFKFGFQARQAKPLDLFVQQSRGVYYFDSLADFEAGRASRLQYTNSITGTPTDAQFQTTYWTYSGFVQDALDITDDLKVTVGFRYERYDEPDKPVLNPFFTARNGFTNQKTIDGQDILMPRISVEWRTTPNLKLSAGGGLFSGGTPDVLTGSPFYNTGVQITGVDIRRTGSTDVFTEANGTAGFTNAIGAAALNNLNADPQFGFQVPLAVQLFQRGTTTGAIPTTSGVIALAPGYQTPAQWKLFLSGQWDAWDGWKLTGDFVATKVRHDLTFYDSRSQPLIINGVQQLLPDGRIRYDGLTNGAVAGKASVNGGAANDLIIGTTDKGHGYTISLTASKSWDWGGDFSVGYAHQKLRDVNAGLFFGTTAGSFYGSVPAGQDPNNDFLGRSVYEIPDRVKLELGYHKKFFGDNETRVSLFAETQTGRHFGFSMADAVSGRGPVFGVTKTAQALYVPDFAGDANPNDLRVGLVTFNTAADLANFKRYVDNFHLGNNQVLGKYSNTNPWVSRIDLSLSQELPTLIPGHKIRVQADIRNVLNLLNSKWGQVAEFVDASGTSTIQLANVACADAAGIAQTAGSPTCVGYRYSNVPTSVPKQRNSALSLWYLQLSLRYEF